MTAAPASRPPAAPGVAESAAAHVRAAVWWSDERGRRAVGGEAQ